MDLLTQSYGIPQRVPAQIVVDVREYLEAVRRTFRKPVCPTIEALTRIPTTVLSGADMKTHVN